MSKSPNEKEKEKLIKGPLRNRDFGFKNFMFFGGKSETIVERLIKEAEEEGKFDNLAGEGLPQKIEEENPYISEDKRLAFKILANSGHAPPWIEMGKDLDTELEKASRARREHIRYLKDRLDYIKRGSPNYFFRDLRILAEDHQRWLKTHSKKLSELNERVHSYNNICPVVEKCKVPLQVEKIIEEYEKQCPAIPTL